MLNALQKKMIGHAFLVLFVGMCAGLGLTASLLGGFEFIPGQITEMIVPGNTAAWARAHAGGILNALMVVGVALVLPGLGFSDKGASRIGWILIGMGWANTVFYWAALFAPNRAISLASNHWGPANLASVIGLVPALVFAYLSLIAVAVIAYRALKK